MARAKQVPYPIIGDTSERPERLFRRGLFIAAFAALGVGLVYYMVFRGGTPILISKIPIYKAAAHPYAQLPAIFQSLPSLLHAFAFASLLGLCWGASAWALAASGAFWFVVNASWELMCISSASLTAGALSRLVGYTIGPANCTFDPIDILAAGAGAMLPLLAKLAQSLLHRQSLRTSGGMPC